MAAAGYLARIRAFLEELAFAAGEGDREAARRAKRVGRVLLAQARSSDRPGRGAEDAGALSAQGARLAGAREA